MQIGKHKAQDGGIGRAFHLTRTTKSQLTAEQPLTKKTLEPTKKDTLHPKTKKKPQ